MADGECPDCGHIWRLHPGVAVGIKACAECIYEEDVGQRGVEEMCRRTPPHKAEQVAARLLALLREEAQPLLSNGRASVHATTVGEQWHVEPQYAAEAIYALRPTHPGALPVCLKPEGAGWYLFPGNGPSLEYWAATDADFAETREVVRAVVSGHYRYVYEQRLVRPFLLRWRPARAVWVCTGYAGEDDVVTGEDWNAPPEPGEPLQVQAQPY